MNAVTLETRRGHFIRHDGPQNTDESLWARWSRFCWLNRPSAREIRELLPTVPISRRLLNVDWWRDEAHRRQAEDIQRLLHWDEPAFIGGTGLDLMTLRMSEELVSPTLQYCRACLAQGFHSALCQHCAVTRCPIHGGTLEERCHYCQHPIDQTFYSAAQYPFGCSRCERPLADLCLPYEARIHSDGKGMAEESVVRERLRAPGVIYGLSGSSAWTPHTKAVGALRMRRARRLAMWGEHVFPGEVHYRLNDVCDEDNSWQINVRSYAAHRELWSLLSRLSARWSKEIAKLEQTSAANLYWCSESAPPNISVVAASMFQLQAAYGGPSAHARAERLADIPSSPQSILPFVMHGTPLFQSAMGNAIVYRHEMIGLACLLLACTGRRPDRAAFRWCTVPPPEHYCPVWRLEQRDDAWLLRVRPRGSVELVQQLIARYQDRRLL